MKRRVVSLLVLISLLTLGACAKEENNSNVTTDDNATTTADTATDNKTVVDSTTKDDANQLEKISIVLDWTPNTNHTGLYVAQEKGYFADAGLEVDIVQPPEDGATALVGAGKAEFGIDFQDSLAASFASNEPVPVTAVAAIIQHNTSGLISLKETGIDSPGKLAGHSYATWDTPIELAIIKKAVEDDGGNYNDVNLIHSGVTDVITALKTNVDAVWVYYAWDGIATVNAGLETNFLKFADYGNEFDYYTPVLVANNDFLENEPDVAKKALDAIRKGYEYAIDNPDEAADILLKAAPELDRDLVVKSQEWLSDQYKSEVVQWGYIDKNRWDTFYSWLYENDLIEREIPSGYGFSDEYLPAK
ncbi:MAG: ABC transporter substrate-binding protein [Lachnotalea sp.]